MSSCWEVTFRCVTRNALGYLSCLNHGYRLTQAFEEDRRGQAGDAPADDRDVRRYVARHKWVFRAGGRVDPE